MLRFVLPFALALTLVASGFAAEVNTITDAEKTTGWKLLFDGRTLDGWQAIGNPGTPIKGWVVQDGAIFHARNAGGGDLVTAASYGDFELTWEWKISAAGNSGLKYNLPDPAKGVGFEYQLLDDEKHPDARVRDTRRQSGALYDLIGPAAERKRKGKLAGEWNHSRVVVQGSHVEHWLNGGKTLEFDFGSDDLKASIAGSKYKGLAKFGEKTKSPILLQDHGDEVSFRSLKLRVLEAK